MALRPLPERPNLATCTAEEYDAYLDGMLEALRRVHRGWVIRYHARRLEEARAA